MQSTTRNRVARHTNQEINRKISRRIDMSIAYYRQNSHLIEQRLRELDEEWDVERVLETNSAALTLAGIALGTMHRRRWLLLSAIVQGFLMQHALEGWCPPLPIIRRMGYRTAAEIERERHALMGVRGGSEGQPQQRTTQGRETAQEMSTAGMGSSLSRERDENESGMAESSSARPVVSGKSQTTPPGYPQVGAGRTS